MRACVIDRTGVLEKLETLESRGAGREVSLSLLGGDVDAHDKYGDLQIREVARNPTRV